MKTLLYRQALLFFISLSVVISITGCSIFRQTTSAPEVTTPEEENPYREVIPEDAETDEGLFDIHKVNDEFFYEIPDSLLNREMLLVSRIAKTADNIGYGGEKLNTQIVRWQKQEDDILLRHVSYENVANDTLPIYRAVQNSNFEPIIASFSVETLNPDSSASVIEVTSLYSTDIPSLGLQSSRRNQYQVRRLDPDRTFYKFSA